MIPLLKGLLHNAHCHIATKTPTPLGGVGLHHNLLNTNSSTREKIILPLGVQPHEYRQLSRKTDPLDPVSNTTNPPNSTTARYLSPPTKLEDSLSPKKTIASTTPTSISIVPRPPHPYTLHNNFDRRTTEKSLEKLLYRCRCSCKNIIGNILPFLDTIAICFFLLSIFSLVLLVYF